MKISQWGDFTTEVTENTEKIKGLTILRDLYVLCGKFLIKNLFIRLLILIITASER